MDEPIDKRWRNVYARVSAFDDDSTRFEIHVNPAFDVVLSCVIIADNQELDDCSEFYGYVLTKMIDKLDAQITRL